MPHPGFREPSTETCAKRGAAFAACCLGFGLLSCIFETRETRGPAEPAGDGNFHAVGDREFSPPNVHSLDLAMGPDGIPYVGYSDGSDSGRAAVMVFDAASGAWKRLGSGPLSEGAAGKVALAMTPAGVLYAAFNDGADSNRVTVKRWRPALDRWDIAGSRGISAREAMQLDLAAASDEGLFLAYKDDTRLLRATVLRYRPAEGEWEGVGPPGFTDSEVNFLSLAVDPSGRPLIGYYDEDRFGKATVMRYLPGSGVWETVGEPGFTPGPTSGSVIASDRRGKPFLAFTDGHDFAYKATVMSPDAAGNWLPVGGAGFSPGQANWVSLALDGKDAPHVAFSDHDRGGSARVMRLRPEGDAWETLGADSLSRGTAFYVSLAFGPENGLWLALTEGERSRISVLKYSPLPE